MTLLNGHKGAEDGQNRVTMSDSCDIIGLKKFFR